MSGAERLVNAIADTMPARIRDRYREEWLADLRHADTVGLRPSSVVVGAAATAVRIDRADPAMTGVPRRALAVRRARWAAALLGIAALLGAGTFISFGWGGLEPGAPAGSVRAAFGVLVAGIALTGVGLLLRSIVLALPVGRRRLVLFAVPAIPLLAVLLAGALLSGGLLLVLLGAGAGLCTVLALGLRRAPDAQPDRRRIVPTAIGCAFALSAVGVSGVLHVVVWNPLAKVPGSTLDDIYARLADAAETPSAMPLTVWAALVATSALALLAAGALPIRRLRIRVSTRHLLVAGLAGVTGAAFSVWVAGFGHGMSIADTFMTSGGDAALTGPLLVGLGIVTGVPAILLTFVPGPIPAPSRRG